MKDKLHSSYQKKIRENRHSEITQDEREANNEYHRNRRGNRTEEEINKAKISGQKYRLKRKFKNIVDRTARKKVLENIIEDILYDSEPFDSQPFGG